jgi:hypothetical protein
MAETDKGAASGERLGVGRARATRAWHADAPSPGNATGAGRKSWAAERRDDDAGSSTASRLPRPAANQLRVHADFFADPRRRRVHQRQLRVRRAAPAGCRRHGDQKFTAAFVSLAVAGIILMQIDAVGDPDARHQSCAPPHTSLPSPRPAEAGLVASRTKIAVVHGQERKIMRNRCNARVRSTRDWVRGRVSFSQ